MDYLSQWGWFTSPVRIDTYPASIDQITLIHDSAYIKRAQQACQSGSAFLDSADTMVCQHSYDVALQAVGGTLQLADHIIAGTINNGFGLLRPPGHHAENAMAFGFCMFNNIAILARYLQKKYGLDKILILDWDVHHGNGTQHLFEEDPSILYISIHQFPFYPGTGHYHETGLGRGSGATLNCPLPARSGDAEYETAFIEKILPKIDEFHPEIILISAGFDAHTADPLADICLSTSFYQWMTERLMEKADRYCNGRLISLLEGGYHLTYLPQCIGTHIKTLINRDKANNHHA